MNNEKEPLETSEARKALLQALPPHFQSRRELVTWLRGRADIIETGYDSDRFLASISKETWSPDLQVVDQIRKEVEPHLEDGRIAVGDRVLTWDQLLVEIMNGTPFGKMYYSAYVEGMTEIKTKTK